MKYIYLIIFIVLLFFSSILFAQTDNQHQKDSLLQVIENSKGEEKLQAYFKYCKLPFNPGKDDLNTYLGVLDRFINEAHRQGNNSIKGDAIKEKIVKMYNFGEKEDLLKLVDDYLVFFSEQEQWDNYYFAYHAMIETYIFQKKYIKASQISKKIYEQAKMQNNISGMETVSYLLGLIYSNTTQIEKARESFTETVTLSEDPNRLTNARRMAYEHLCRILLQEKEYKEALERVDELTILYNNFFKINPDALANKIFAYVICFQFKAEAYNGLDDYDKAEHYCKMAEEIAPNDPRAMSCIYYTRAKVAEKQSLFQKSLDYYEKAEQFYLKLHAKVPSIVLTDKARVLCKIGRGNEAYPLFEGAIETNNETGMALLNSQVEELRTVYDVDKHISEKERNRNYFLLASAVCILLIIALGIWIYYNRLVVRKNKTLAIQIKELQIQQDKLETDLLNKTTFDIHESGEYDDLCPESRKNELCIAIRDIILKDKIYRDSTLTRDMLIERLGTNKNIFIDAFQFCFGMSFPEFINNLRLKDAITLLENSDLSIEQISEKVGFGSLRTFQRQFQNKYNMTPKEYQKASIK